MMKLLSSLLLLSLVSVGRVFAQDPSVATLGMIDANFRPSLTKAPYAVKALSNGRIMVAGNQSFTATGGAANFGLARLLADGSVDPMFNASIDSAGIVSNFWVQSDGKIVIAGSFVSVNGVAIAKFARLTTTGVVDASFTPAVALRDSATRPILLADGRWLTANPAHDSANNRTVQLARFTADGAVDTGYGAVTLAPTSAAPIGDFDGNPTFGSLQSTVAADGRVYLAVPFGAAGSSLIYNSGSSLFFRLLSDGSNDPSFAAKTIAAQIDWLAATALGLVVESSQYNWVRPRYPQYLTTIFRLDFEGNSDSRFTPFAVDESNNYPTLPSAHYDLFAPAVADDGSVYAVSFLSFGHQGVIRLKTDGTRDRSFAAELPSDSVYLITPLTGGRLLTSGNFTAAGDASSYLRRLTPDRTSATNRLANISIRTRAGIGDDTLILGFITTGGTKQFLLRGAGPALSAYQVQDPLADPQLSLYTGSKLITFNDDWLPAFSTVFASVGAFAFPIASRDSALIATVNAQNYSLFVTGKSATTGIALAELYDTDPAPADDTSPRLFNFSARSRVGTGDDVLIAGFNISGTNARTLLIRAAGPKLSTYGVANTLPDPHLNLYRGGTLIGSNEDWSSTDLGNFNRIRLTNAMAAVGAFAFDPLSKDAALLVTLPPGSYSAQVSGNGAQGVALVEVYEVP